MKMTIETPFVEADLKVLIKKAGQGRKDWKFDRHCRANDLALMIELDRGIRALQKIQASFGSPRRITAKLSRESLGG